MSQKYVIRSLNRPIEEADRLRRENRTLRARFSRLSDFSLHVTASLDLEIVQQRSWTAVPWESDSKRLLDAAAPQQVGYSYLAAWFGEAEHLWDTHGAGRMSFSEQLDYFGKLSAQFPASATKSAPSVRVFVPPPEHCRPPLFSVNGRQCWNMRCMGRNRQARGAIRDGNPE